MAPAAPASRSTISRGKDSASSHSMPVTMYDRPLTEDDEPTGSSVGTPIGSCENAPWYIPQTSTTNPETPIAVARTSAKPDHLDAVGGAAERGAATLTGASEITGSS